MKKIKYLVIALLLLFVLAGCSNGKANERNFKKIKVGMTPDQVHAILGEPDDTENEQYFEFQYWFEGATSMEDAHAKYKKGKAIKYYLVIFFAEDKINYVIESKDDIVTGIWGKY